MRAKRPFLRENYRVDTKNTFLITFTLISYLVLLNVFDKSVLAILFLYISSRIAPNEFRDYLKITSSWCAANESRGQRSYFIWLKKFEGKDHVTSFRVTWRVIGIIRFKRQKYADVSSPYLRIYCIFRTFLRKSPQRRVRYSNHYIPCLFKATYAKVVLKYKS